MAQTHSHYDAQQAKPLVFSEVAFGLDEPWAVAFLPGGDFLVTEREGRMRVIDASGRVGPPVHGVPAVAAAGEGGLLDLVLDHDFDQNRRLYFCFSEPDPASASRSSTALASATLSERHDRLTDVRVIFHQMPRVRSNQHFGCRIAQAGDGSLFLTLGERAIARDQAQRVSNHLGAIVRVQIDGAAHPDNPFARTHVGLPETWSWGHRNPQGAVVTPDGALWTHEHGPQGGDELNVTRAGGNYGWPVITYGRSYGGGGTQREGMEQPVHYWDPPMGPSGMAYLHSDRYGPDWQGSLFVGSLYHGALSRLKIVDGAVQEEAWYQIEHHAPIRDVREGRDGLLYVLTDGEDGRLLRIEPPEQTDVWAADGGAEGSYDEDARADAPDAMRLREDDRYFRVD